MIVKSPTDQKSTLQIFQEEKLFRFVRQSRAKEHTVIRKNQI